MIALVKKYLKQILEKIRLKSLNVNLLDFVKLYIEEIKEDSIDHLAKSMAFSFMMAIFPGIIFLFTLIPHIPVPHFSEDIMSYLNDVLPDGIYSFAFDEIHDIIHRRRSGLMSIGFGLALFSSTSGTLAMISGFNNCYRTKEQRSYIMTRILAINLTLLLTVVLLFSAFLLVISDVILERLVVDNLIMKDFNYYFLLVIKPAIAFCTFYLSLACIYYYAPTIKEKWHFMSAGALMASILCVACTLLFGFYFTNFASYNKLYGSIGTIIALMFWLYIISNVILYGFELNVTIEKIKADNIKLKREARAHLS